MIAVNTSNEPVVVQLEWPYAEVTLRIRPLPPSTFTAASREALKLMNTPAAVVRLAVEGGLLSDEQHQRWLDESASQSETARALVSGLTLWVGAVFLAEAAVEAWTGIVDQDGRPVPTTRQALALLMGTHGLADQIVAAIDRVRKLKLPHPAVGELA